jgi:DNA-binding transcriptional ArsR family regulator
MAKKKGNNGELHIPGSYFKIPDGLILSKEFNRLKSRAKSVYLLMLAVYDPFKPDEEFAVPYKEATEITGMSSATISEAVKDLMKAGFIKIPQRGRYPKNLSLYKIHPEPLEKKYPKVKRGKGTLPDYIAKIKSGIE